MLKFSNILPNENFIPMLFLNGNKFEIISENKLLRCTLDNVTNQFMISLSDTYLFFSFLKNSML